MAGETWLGGNIIGERPNRGTTGGGYIPAAEIPNAPKTVDMPMIGNYPSMFTQKFEYAQGAPDMSKRAADLMQKELPSSFEEAGNIRAQAAGQGQMAIGKAIASGGETFGKAIGVIGETLSRIRAKTLDNEDNAQKAQFEILDRNYKVSRQGIMDANPPEKWPELIQKLNGDFQKTYSGMGVRPETKALIQMSGNSSVSTTGVALEVGNYQYLTKQQYALGEKMINDGRTLIQEGDFAAGSKMANDGVALLHGNGTYNKELADQEYSKTKFLVGKTSITEALKTPQGAVAVVNQAEGATKGVKSEDFPVLNSNPAMAPNLLYEAQQKVKEFKRQQISDVQARIANGDIGSAAELDRELKKPGSLLTSDVAETLKKVYSSEYVPQIFGKHIAMVDKIARYDPHLDKTGDGYTLLRAQIEAEIDKESRAKFITKLDNKVDQRNEPTSTQKRERDAEIDRTTRDNKLGLLVDPKEREALMSGRSKMAEYDDPKKTEGERKKILDSLTAQEAAAIRNNDRATLDRLNFIDDFFDKNKEFSPGALIKAVDDNDPTAKNRTRNAGDSASTEVRRATPSPSALVGVPTREQVAAARGMPVSGGTSGWTPTGLPRDIKAIGRSPGWQSAFTSAGPRSEMVATAYTKFEPGGNQVKGREGPLYTMEKYAQGLVPYVSVAMDPKSAWQGQYVISSAHPGVLFKVEDIGGAFKEQKERAIDIAFDNRMMETNYKSTGTWKVVSPDEAATINGAPKQQGITGTGRPDSPIVATVEETHKAPSGAPITKGTLNVGGVPYQYRSGGYGRGNLPPGEYVVTEHMPHRNTPGMTVGDVGFSFALSDKYDPRVGGTRTLLRIHPDGGTAGTAGCIGIVGGKEVQKQFRDDLSIAIRKAGGKLYLRVG